MDGAATVKVGGKISLEAYLPKVLKKYGNDQGAIPSLAKDQQALTEIEAALGSIPTKHRMIRSDATKLELASDSVHLVVTSPPYWTLKEYNHHERQLGHVADYDEFLSLLGEVWTRCYDALVPGGRVVCVVGDVCLSRRRNGGRHTVVPLHASIQEQCRKIGFDNLAPIIWHKISNAKFEASRNSSFLGKPFEPNSVIKNDIEFILMLRKPGGYRSPTRAEKLFSVIGEENHKAWFQQIWTNVKGASTKNHPAPYPIELAKRLIRMFSFAGDTVLDPFLGSGTTAIAAALVGRNSIGSEIDPPYLKLAVNRFGDEVGSLISAARLEVEGV